MISLISFHTPLQTSYLRNNRSTKQKSIRCFPSCGIKGHVSGGFCGLPLRVTVKLSSKLLRLEQYIFIAEIRPSREPRLSNQKLISKTEIANQLRTKFDFHSKGGELFLAETNILSNNGEESLVDLTFNSQQCSWDYAWRSNR